MKGTMTRKTHKSVKITRVDDTKWDHVEGWIDADYWSSHWNRFVWLTLYGMGINDTTVVTDTTCSRTVQSTVWKHHFNVAWADDVRVVNRLRRQQSEQDEGDNNRRDTWEHLGWKLSSETLAQKLDPEQADGWSHHLQQKLSSHWVWAIHGPQEWVNCPSCGSQIRQEMQSRHDSVQYRGVGKASSNTRVSLSRGMRVDISLIESKDTDTKSMIKHRCGDFSDDCQTHALFRTWSCGRVPKKKKNTRSMKSFKSTPNGHNLTVQLEAPNDVNRTEQVEHMRRLHHAIKQMLTQPQKTRPFGATYTYRTCACNTVQISAIHISNQKRCSFSAWWSKTEKNNQRPCFARLCCKSLDCRHVHNHEPHRCSRTHCMRARWCKFAMAALAEISLGEQETFCRGSEIVLGTRFPAESSCRILVRTRGSVTSQLGPNFMSSTWPRKPNRFVAFVQKSLLPKTSNFISQSCVREPLFLRNYPDKLEHVLTLKLPPLELNWIVADSWPQSHRSPWTTVRN